MARGEHGDDVHLDVGGRDVRISSPDRVYFPERGETKLDLARYYLAVGDGIVRALRDRPTPINIAAVRLLGDRCAALDIYLWLAYRLHSLRAAKLVGWPALHAQFGANTKQM